MLDVLVSELIGVAGVLKSNGVDGQSTVYLTSLVAEFHHSQIGARETGKAGETSTGYFQLPLNPATAPEPDSAGRCWRGSCARLTKSNLT